MLTVAQVKAAGAAARPYKIADAGGLYLHVTPSGRRTWRMKFRFAGKEKLLTFGAFPDVTLTEARDRRDAARRQLRDQVDPSGGRRRADALRRAAELAATFEVTARAWHAHQLPRWTAIHANDVLTSLERDAFPAIGGMPLAAIDPPVVLQMLRAVERRGCIETARRLRQRISAVFAFAMSEGAATSDPAAIVRKALAPATGKGRQPALLELDDARALIAETDSLDAHVVTKLASRLLALTAVRLAAVRGAEWAEFEDVDWDGTFIGPLRPTWRVPAARMKLSKAKKGDAVNAHLVPLSPAAVDVLRAMRALGAAGCFVFPGRGAGRPLSETAIGHLYGRTRFRGQHVPHGWRATFSTLLNERFPADRASIDRALAHVPKDKVEAAYNRAEHLARRRWLYVQWSAMLGYDRVEGGVSYPF